MRDVSHTNPYTGDSAGHLFRRGPVVAADGGRREAVEADAADEAGTESEGQATTMEDVSHTPPNSSEDANRVFERGGSEALRASNESSGARSAPQRSEDEVESEE